MINLIQYDENFLIVRVIDITNEDISNVEHYCYELQYTNNLYSWKSLITPEDIIIIPGDFYDPVNDKIIPNHPSSLDNVIKILDSAPIEYVPFVFKANTENGGVLTAQEAILANVKTFITGSEPEPTIGFDLIPHPEGLIQMRPNLNEMVEIDPWEGPIPTPPPLPTEKF